MHEGKLMASEFGRAIEVMKNPHWINIKKLREEIFFPKDTSVLPAVKWENAHKGNAVDEYCWQTERIVKPTGIWLFPNGIMAACPDALVFENEHDVNPVGIIKVKCPYFNPGEEHEWDNRLGYLDRNRKLKRDHDYYHEIQGALLAVDVQWCDLLIWTCPNLLIVKVLKDDSWKTEYFPRLERFYQKRIRRLEDQYDPFSQDIEEPIIDLAKPSRDLNSILNPIGYAEHLLRETILLSFSLHIRRIIFQKQSKSRLGMSWVDAVKTYWICALNEICEKCLKKYFTRKWYTQTTCTLRNEVRDIMENISGDDCAWTVLLFEPDFARKIRRRVKSMEPYDLSHPACTCPSGYISCNFSMLFNAN